MDPVIRRARTSDGVTIAYVSNVYRKIDARGRADATAWALRHGVA
jgi:DNA-binding CsgD family transcriptional regulator